MEVSQVTVRLLQVAHKPIAKRICVLALNTFANDLN
jgi:hypothetical protein